MDNGLVACDAVVARASVAAAARLEGTTALAASAALKPRIWRREGDMINFSGVRCRCFDCSQTTCGKTCSVRLQIRPMKRQVISHKRGNKVVAVIVTRLATQRERLAGFCASDFEQFRP